MPYIACPNCKQIKIHWDDKMSEITNLVLRTQAEIGLPCAECFAERKVIFKECPQTCKHGRPLHVKCMECKALLEYGSEDELDFVASTKRRNNHG